MAPCHWQIWRMSARQVRRRCPNSGGRAGITLGYARSTESDYVSDGVSLNTVIDFNEKATLLRLGVAGTADEIRAFFTDERQDKDTYDLIVGVTQVINAETTLTVNLTLAGRRDI